jgi:hypothetical protein
MIDSTKQALAVEARRLELGLSRKDWTYILDIAQSHYSEFVNGKRSIPMRVAARAFEFGVAPEKLFCCRPGKGKSAATKLVKARHE